MKITLAGEAIVITGATDDQKKFIETIAKNKPIPPELITGAEVADICGVHTKTASRWGRSGLIRQIRVGPRKIMYNSEEIYAFASTGTNHTVAVGDACESGLNGMPGKKQNGAV